MSTQTALDYRTNRDLFSNYHLDEHLPETEAWNKIDEEELQAAYDDIKALWDEQGSTVEQRNESQLEEKFIRPMFRKLGIPFEVEESANETQRRPDYGFFETEADSTDAFQRREEGGDFYKNAIAVADAKRWGRKLDTRGKKKRDYENPSHQIDQYLRFTSTTWGVLTNGQKWRLYYKPTSHKLDSYYEVDLPTVLETGNLEEFKYFYLFFRHEAFVPDASGDAFLDDVYEESNLFAQDLGQDLQDNIYDAIVELSEGFLQYPENELDEDKLDLIHDSSLIYLYRIIFILYAEAEGRDLLNTNNEIYESQYSLNQLKQEVAEELESGDPKYRDWQDNLHSQLDELFTLIDQGSKSRGIPEEDLYIPAYNGGLFRTSPGESGSKEARFLANNVVGDEHLARVIELLTRSESSNGAGKIFVDYSSLDVRHLGSIYEGLLEYDLNVADEPLALDDGEYVVADEDSEVIVERDDVYLTTGSGERKATGSYYTPEYVVESIVDETLKPLVTDIREDLVGYDSYSEGGFADEFAERVFNLKILDPAMGSGHFLTNTIDYLARQIIDAQEKQAEQQGVETIDDNNDINWARRKVVQRCIYGVDINPLATELAKVSLWLRTLAAEQPLAFLDHHLKTGNSLVGSDIQNVLADEDESKTEEGQLTLEQSFAHTRQQALDHVMDRFSELLAMDNETLEDAKEMEDVYQSVQRDPLYQKLLAMANVHTASQFGLDVPSDADKRMAEALRGDSWEDIEGQDWFCSSQVMADDKHFFHWELEFPVAFYDIDGNRLDDAGFDAVIGNPPYVEPSGELEDYLRSRYEVTEYFVDLFHTFIEQGIQKLRSGGEFGYIVPEPWLTIENKKMLREYVLNNTNIEEIIRFSTPVFDDATVDTVILHLSKTDGDDTISITEIDNSDTQLNKKVINEISQDEVSNSVKKRIDSKRTWEETKLLKHIRDQSVSLASIADLAIGVQAYNSSKHTQEQIENEVFHSSEKKSEEYMPQISGKDIDRYNLEFDGNTWIKYGSHLHDRRDKRYLTGPRILVRQIPASGKHKIQAVFTEQPYCNYNTVLNILVNESNYDPRTVLGILNSSLMSWIFPRIANSVVTESFPKLSVVDLENLPIREITGGKKANIEREDLKPKMMNCIDSGEYKESLAQFPSEERTEILFISISILVEMMETFKSQRSELALSLVDYLGNYKQGPKLPDIGFFQPAESSILNATTEEHEKLQIGNIKIAREGSRATIYATARYKPEDKDEFETDTYGYTETEYNEAFTLTNLSDEEAALVNAFVPVAVEKAGGFANFRDNATKTNSLIDRLKVMRLPNIDDVADDLERYIKVKERADELDEKIEKTDQLIDEIVYDLYNLTDEEIDIVESAVADD